jgi:HAD superfamily hydrolase (TIGR01509 family)
VLVIFDCDGVLVDSETMAFKTDNDMVRALGLDWTVEECMQKFLGRSTKSCVEIIEAALSRPVPEGWVETWQEAMHDALRKNGVAPIPGIFAALDGLDAARVPYCVASSGEMEKMDITLSSSGLMPRLAGRIYNSAMVARGKPAPDLFLHAAKSMGAAPADCVVVEDSVAGVTAGVAAGMRVMAYAAAVYVDREGMRRAGGELFEDMANLPRLIGLA